MVAIDAGGTSTRALAVDAEGRVLGVHRTETGAAGPAASGPDLEASLHDWLSSLGPAIGNAQVHVVAGVAGAGRPAGARRARAALRRAFAGSGLSPPVAEMRTDAEIALWCASPDGPGPASVVLAGTGAIAMAQDAAGATARCGGYGRLLDDAGGGFWIGARALRMVPRAADGRCPEASALAQAALAALGLADVDALVEAAPRLWTRATRVAALAPHVCALAAAGDAEAARIVDDAGRALAELAVVARRAAGLPAVTPLAYGGGLLLSEPTGALAAALARHLPPALLPHTQPLPVPPAVGAACRWLQRTSGAEAARRLVAARRLWAEALR